MKHFLIKFELVAVAVIFLFPGAVFAQENSQICSPKGYSIININGIFTDEKGAKDNSDTLLNAIPLILNNEPITVDYLFNPSHLGGLGDLVKSIQQKLFDSWAVSDYDLVEMIKDASEKVKTQKLLVVGYSQGNFYSNSFYDKVAGKSGGVPKESIGVYSVATPAGRVAGNGKYITSDTDKVIAGWVSAFTLGSIMKPNTHIEFKDGSNGHSFSDIYLKYRGGEIISDIGSSLNKLAVNSAQNEERPCIAKPDLGLVGNTRQYAKGALLFVFDPLAGKIVKNVRDAGDIVFTTGKFVYDTTLKITRAVSDVLAIRKEPANRSGLLAQISNTISSPEVSLEGVAEPAKPSIVPVPDTAKIIKPAEASVPQNAPVSAPQVVTSPLNTVSTTSVSEPIKSPSKKKRSSGASSRSASTPPVTFPVILPIEPPPVPLAPVPPTPVPPVEPPIIPPAPLTISLPEVADFSVMYDKDKLELVFSWMPFVNPSDITAPVTHKIFDESDELVFETNSESDYRKRIYEIGRDYDFSINAFDVLGVEIASGTKSISVPSFVNGVHFYSADYKHLSDESTEMPLLEFSYDTYPFAPQDMVFTSRGMPVTGPNYKVAVFYLNKDAPGDPIANEFLFNSSPFDSDLSSVLRVKYLNCVGGGAYFQTSLLLPDAEENCGNGGGVRNGAMDYRTYLADQDNHLVLPVQGPNGETIFSSDDYFTVAYYGFFRDYPWGTSIENGGAQTFKLLAVDQTHHFFDEDDVVHQKPNPPANLQFALDEAKSVLNISWDAATDPDSADVFLRYEISYDSGTTWKEVSLTDSLVVAAGDIYTTQVRAIDDFGERSNLLSGSFNVPEMQHPKFGISNLRWGNIDENLSLNFDYPSHPFMPDDGNSHNAMIFYLNSLPPIFYGYAVASDSSYPQIKLAYYSCNGSFSDRPKLILTRYELSACGGGNRAYNFALYPSLAPEAGNISLQIRDLLNADKTIDDLSSDDYFTVGFYSIDNYGNVTSIGNDTHKYYFEE